MAKVPWAKGERFERKARIMIGARAREVFPLLCPVREYEWIPDWRCRMIYSKSGVAEKDAMFTTGMLPLGRELWTCTLYESPSRIEYLVTHGSKAAFKLELALSEEGGRTVLDWTMRFTAASPRIGSLLRRKMSERAFASMMASRERQFEEYFSARRAPPAAP